MSPSGLSLMSPVAYCKRWLWLNLEIEHSASKVKSYHFALETAFLANLPVFLLCKMLFGQPCRISLAFIGKIKEATASGH
jgi:hypothetical protein